MNGKNHDFRVALIPQPKTAAQAEAAARIPTARPSGRVRFDSTNIGTGRVMRCATLEERDARPVRY